MALPRALIRFCALAVALGGPAVAADPDWAEIAPLLRVRCVMCHSQDAAALGLRLDTYEGALAGSERGPILLPGDVAGSELVRRLRGESTPRMPFLSRPLPDGEIELIERWIAAGLPEAAAAAADRRRPQPRRSPIRNSAARSSRMCGGPSPGASASRGGAKRVLR